MLGLLLPQVAATPRWTQMQASDLDSVSPWGDRLRDSLRPQAVKWPAEGARRPRKGQSG